MNDLKIVALGGLNNSGKTNILNKLIENLLRDSTFGNIEGNGGIKIVDGISDYSTDGFAVFNHNGKIVCITTGGDNAKILQNNIQKAKDFKSEILVTACHVRSESVFKPIVDEDPQALIIFKPRSLSKVNDDLYLYRLKKEL